MNDTIIIDSREKEKAIQKIKKYFDDNNIKYITSKLYCGDYQLLSNGKIVVDRKQNLAEIMQNVTQKRFRDELIRAKKAGIHLIILIEHSKDITCIDDITKWKNPRLEQYKRTLKWKLNLNYHAEYNEWELYRQAKEKGLKPRKPPISPEQLRKALHTIEDNKEDYDVSFEFCSKSETGQKILELLLNDEVQSNGL